MRHTRSLLASLSLSLLLGHTVLSATPPPPTPGLPEGVHPLSPELAKHMDEVDEEIARAQVKPDQERMTGITPPAQ